MCIYIYIYLFYTFITMSVCKYGDVSVYVYIKENQS